MKKLLQINKSTLVGAGAIMLAALLWSLDGVFIRPKFYTFPAPLIVFLEHFIGFLFLSPFIIFGWSKIKLIRKKDWGAIIWVSAFGGVLGTIMITQAFFSAVHGEVTFATVVILQKLQPLFALLMARIVLGEKLTRRLYIWAGTAIVAAYFLAFGKTGLDISGINWFHHAAFFSVLAAFAFGSSTVFGKRVVNHLDYKLTAALRFALTSILTLGIILLNKDILEINSLGTVHWQFLLLIVFTSGAGAIFIYYYGLRRVSASTATISELFWPFSAVILDYIINKNVLNAVQIIAAIIMLLAIYRVVKYGVINKIEFSAQVTRGLRRGTKMGLPTINLNKLDLDLPYGIYSVEAIIDQVRHRGVLHFGYKETFNEGASLELIIKEHIPRLETKQILIKIIKPLREIKKFKNTQALKEQIEKDVGLL